MNKLFTKTLLTTAAVLALNPALANPNWMGSPSYTLVTTQMNSTSTVPLPSNWLSLPANGGIVTQGLFNIPVDPAPVQGTLLRIIVDRGFTVTSPTTLVTSIDVDGFSIPPFPGAAGNSSGAARTMVTDTLIPNPLFPNSHNVVSGSTVTWAPGLSLANGFDTWVSAPTSSGPFNLLPGNYYLRQVFDLDGRWLSGPAGTWQVDIPVISMLTAVPEPSTYALMGLGLAFLGIAKSKQSRHGRAG